MPEQKQKKIIRLSLPFLVLFFVISCSQQEDFVRQQKRKIEVKDVKLIDLLDDPVFSDAYAKLTKGKISARGGDLGKSVLEEQFGFTIDTAHAAKMIEANGYVSYTFLIKRDSASTAFFENLLITIDSTNAKSAQTIKYNLTTPIIITDHGAYYYESTKEMTTLYNERMNFGWVNCQNVVFPMCDIHGGSYNYDHVFMGWETCRIAYYHSEWVCTIPGPPDEGGGGNPPPTPPPGPGEYTGPGGPITIPLPEVESPDNCQKLNALSKDIGFKGRLANLRNLAQPPYNNEFLYKMYLKPNITDNNDKYDFQYLAGPPNTSDITFNYASSILGLLHSHPPGRYSIFSSNDIRQLSDFIQSGVSTDVVMGVVNTSSTAYIIQINNICLFNAFSAKYLTTNYEEFALNIFEKKFGIRPGNSQTANERAFLNTLKTLNAGITVYRSQDPFSQFEKITLINNEVVPETCN